MSRPRLFISYSHQPPHHAESVRRFIEKVQTSNDPIDLHHDGEVEDPQGPPEGWTPWMRSQVESADWILVVCNEPYLKSWQKSPTAGRGVAYEASLLLHELYDARMINHKLIPVVFKKAAKDFIPVELRDATNYTLPDDWTLLLNRIVKSTWLGRFLDAAEPDKIASTTSLSASEVMDDAETLAMTAGTDPAFDLLLDALVTEAGEYAEALARAATPLEVEAAKQAFRMRFCPRAKELFALTGSLPESLARVFNHVCNG